jgi:TolB protein
MVTFLFAKEVVITKYIDEKPVINVDFKGDSKDLLILKRDLDVTAHFKYYINQKNKAYYNFVFFAGKNRLLVKYYEDGKLKLTKTYTIKDPKQFVFLIHKAVVDINNYFDLPDVSFLTKKVVYSLLDKPKEASIYIADYTFTYNKKIISGGLNIFPKWANNKQTAIFYTHLAKKANLYEYNLNSAKRKFLLSSQGLLIVSDVKGDNILITMPAKNGVPDVFEYNLKTRKLINITKNPAIDVSGKFWKNSIVFISDRYGNPYVFEQNNNEATRVMYQGKNQIGLDVYNNKLVISTRESNDMFEPNTFNLFLLNKDSDSLERLTFSGQNSSPKFSTDGDTIMFIKRKKFKYYIGLIRLNEEKVFYFKLPKMIQSFDW